MYQGRPEDSEGAPWWEQRGSGDRDLHKEYSPDSGENSSEDFMQKGAEAADSEQALTVGIEPGESGTIGPGEAGLPSTLLTGFAWYFV